MRRINHQTIDARLYQLIGAFAKIAGRSDSSGDAQTSQIVFRCARILDCLLNIFDSDQSLDALVAINNQQFLYPMFLQYGFGLLECSANRNSDQRLFGHYFRNRNLKTSFESQVAVGNDADEVAVLVYYRHAAYVEPLHYLKRLPHRFSRKNRYRVNNHS